jgi:hypothetical protein
MHDIMWHLMRVMADTSCGLSDNLVKGAGAEGVTDNIEFFLSFFFGGGGLYTARARAHPPPPPRAIGPRARL